MELFSKARGLMLAAPVALLASPAFAAGSDVVTAVQTAVDGAKADVSAIGLAIIGVVVAVVAFMWIRRVMK